MAVTYTNIVDLWTPAIWIKGADEQARILPAFLTSGAVVQSPLFDGIASGGGVSANLPMFKDITDIPDTPQVESTAPVADKITAGVNVAPILNREKAFGVSALAAAVTAEDPVGAILRQLALRRQKQRQQR